MDFVAFEGCGSEGGGNRSKNKEVMSGRELPSYTFFFKRRMIIYLGVCLFFLRNERRVRDMNEDIYVIRPCFPEVIFID